MWQRKISEDSIRTLAFGNTIRNYEITFGEGLKLDYDKDKISALAPRRQNVWNRIKDADFMTDDEKREAVGMKPIG